jgi:uncharacterized RDD family membrane protein YckC
MSKKVHKLSKLSQKKEQTSQPKAYHATIGKKFKALVVDSFMLLMPIMYIVFYFVFDGREGFQTQQLQGWMAIIIPLAIVEGLFLAKSGQTPGYKAYNLYVVDSTTGKKPSTFVLFFRTFATFLSLFTLFGWLMMFFRKDAKTLHDLLTSTMVVYKPHTKEQPNA